MTLEEISSAYFWMQGILLNPCCSGQLPVLLFPSLSNDLDLGVTLLNAVLILVKISLPSFLAF